MDNITRTNKIKAAKAAKQVSSRYRGYTLLICQSSVGPVIEATRPDGSCLGKFAKVGIAVGEVDREISHTKARTKKATLAAATREFGSSLAGELQASLAKKLVS